MDDTSIDAETSVLLIVDKIEWAADGAANPYLFIASQIAAGLDGLDNKTDPGPADDSPYETDHPMLPDNLSDALKATQDSTLISNQFGGLFMEYYGKLKAAELARFEIFLKDNAIEDMPDTVTGWEQNEYYDFF